MAADAEEPAFISKRKRKRLRRGKKLQCGDHVEVRSLEEGFLGSWHSGIVIACSNLERHVEYRHLLREDGSGPLYDVVSVSSVVDGIASDCERYNYRGSIRPLPPPIEFSRYGLTYGMCMDAYYMDAWWEGVVFDHEDGSGKRRIFFPDLGDEMDVDVNNLRVTQDWNEVTEEWQRRGKWFFLELIEKYKLKYLISVSVKQIWYDVREKEDFVKIREWISLEKSAWEQLVLEVIADNFSIFLGELFQLAVELPEPTLHDSIKAPAELEAHENLVSSEAIQKNCAFVELCSHVDSDGLNTNTQKQRISSYGETQSITRPEGLPCLPPSQGILASTTGKSSKEDEKRLNVQPKQSNGCWLPVGPDILPGQKCIPNVIAQYEHVSAGKRRGGEPLTTNLRMHLSYLGWRIEHMRDLSRTKRIRYVSPDGKSFHSLLEVCRVLRESGMDIVTPALQSSHKVAYTLPNDVFSPSDMPLKSSDDLHAESGNLLSGASSAPRTMATLDKCAPVRLNFPMDEEVNIELMESSMPTHEKAVAIIPEGPPTLPPNQDGILSNIIEKPSEAYDSFVKRKPKLLEHQTSECWVPAGPKIVPEPKFLPDSIAEYIRASEGKHKPREPLTTNARMHLSFLGWRIEHMRDRGGLHRVRYISPDGKCFLSLLQVCHVIIESGRAVNPSASQNRRNNEYTSLIDVFTDRHPEEAKEVEDPAFSPSFTVLDDKPKYCPQAVLDYVELVAEDAQKSNLASHRQKAKKHLLALGWTLKYALKGKRNELREFHYISPRGRCYYSLITACRACIDEGLLDRRLSSTATMSPNLPRSKRRKVSGALIKFGNVPYSNQSARAVRYSKRPRQVPFRSSSHRGPRTVLSWLIDNNVVLPRARVYYKGRKDRGSMKEGWITRDGIRCKCCQKVFNLSSFEAHAGSNYHRPSANIFLDDGRSLLECQKQILRDSIHDKTKSDCHQGENDSICSVCHYGGELILCDRCPSAFHTYCLGLRDVPDGEWFCPSCCCKICGLSKFEVDIGHLADDSLVSCIQCEHKYHTRCLWKAGVLKLDKNPERRWFCSSKCEEIFLGLQKLLGQRISVGVDNLTWTLLKSITSGNPTVDLSDIDAYSRLNVALHVMHECFEPVKEAYTGRDLVEDIVFSRGSELKRLNFSGFYTLLLERNEELITVAAVRVYGEKVAEVPLVATRLQYRRLGMCRILMNELEKNLKDLGVERLILPAVPAVLGTWITSFGFSRMSGSQRLQFLSYTFLEFQDTVLCHKILVETPTTGLINPSETQCKLDDVVGNDDNVALDGASSTSEVFQAEQTEDCTIVDNELVKDGQAVIVEVNEKEMPESLHYLTKSSSEFPVEGANPENRYASIKCYKRRQK